MVKYQLEIVKVIPVLATHRVTRNGKVSYATWATLPRDGYYAISFYLNL